MKNEAGVTEKIVEIINVFDTLDDVGKEKLLSYGEGMVAATKRLTSGK